MIAEGRDFVTSAWWGLVPPGLAILLSCSAFNLIGDWMRDNARPKLDNCSWPSRRRRPQSAHEPRHAVGTIKAVDASRSAGARRDARLVGDSGSGKSMTCLSIVRLTPRPASRILGARSGSTARIC